VDPWRVFFTTDHPNGASFTTYPKILHLLMDASERGRWMETLPRIALRRTQLPSISREYTLNEVAILTRASPARRLGLEDRGHLGPGAVADVAVYTDQPNRTVMFQAAHLVFKNGELVVRDGRVVKWPRGRTHTVKPAYDRKIVERVARYAESRWGYGPEDYAVPESALGREGIFQEHPCRT
jgi:formylmethanofuran dehydrogenase subunit A